jgi:hypothetical protein
MIYGKPSPDEAIDQGELIDGCPLLFFKEFPLDPSMAPEVGFAFRQVIVLTQTCDLANEKTVHANVAEVFDAQQLVDQLILKPADVKGPLRAGRVWGLYFLPASDEFGLPEMIVDFRRLHTVRLDLLKSLCRAGKCRACVLTPYREHLAKHFADTFSRIGLPQPYETM